MSGSAPVSAGPGPIGFGSSIPYRLEVPDFLLIQNGNNDLFGIFLTENNATVKRVNGGERAKTY